MTTEANHLCEQNWDKSEKQRKEHSPPVPSQLAQCHSTSHSSSQARPARSGKPQSRSPQLRLDEGPSGVFFWVAGFQLSDTIPVSQRWQNSFFPCAGKRCFEKLAAGVGIREAGEGYHQVTMATVSLASPSPNPASPHQLVGSCGDGD